MWLPWTETTWLENVHQVLPTIPYSLYKYEAGFFLFLQVTLDKELADSFFFFFLSLILTASEVYKHLTLAWLKVSLQ